MTDISWCVINKDGDNLFDINYVPPIGSTLHYYVDWDLLRPVEDTFADHTIEHWKSIDGKYWTVKDVYCEVRNYRGKEVPVHFVEVEEKVKQK